MKKSFYLFFAFIINGDCFSQSSPPPSISWLTITNGYILSDNSYFNIKCAMLEPLALEPAQTGTFTYGILSNQTKYLMASFFTRIGSAGRLEVRNTFNPLPLRGVTLYGLGAAKSAAVISNPALATYINPISTYYTRLQTIDDLKTRKIDFTAALQTKPFLPGPYGAIITSVSYVDLSWIAAICNGGGWNLWNEIDDTYTFRNGTSMQLPVSKLVINSMDSGNQPDGVHQFVSSSQPPAGTVTYVILPSNYGAVIDNTNYIFRDDFMTSSLDLSKWNRIESGTTMEIDTNFQWIKCTGNTSWNTNVIYSKTSTSRIEGKTFMIDVFVDLSTGSQPRGAFGFTDGMGYDYTNFVHGINFTNTSINILENGSVCSTSGKTYTNGCSYRLRITLKSIGAVYEIQGGTEYPAIGSNSWTDLNPSGLINPTTTPLYVGLSAFDKSIWASDVKIY